MHFICYICFFFLYLFVYSSTLLPQTTLSAGDLMMVTVNADGNDNFDFVPLIDLEANTVIYFADNAWNSSAVLKTNEGTLKYTSSSAVSAGSIVSYPGSIGGNWSTEDAGFNIAGTGDNILVFQGSSSSPTFIYGIGWAISSPWISSGIVSTHDSYIPTEISTSDNTVVQLTSADNNQYITSNGTTGPKSTLRYLTSQTGNYNSNSSTAYTALSGSFTIGQAINGSSGFRILSSPVSGTIYSNLLEPLWTQGLAGGDVTTGTVNVWLYNASGASWSPLTNLATDSYTAGSGVLVYVFSDVDNDGVDDLPVYISVPGSENSPTVSVSTPASAWNLLGNPYEATIDADQLFSDNTNYTSVVYVWDDANSGGADYLTWNGSAGDLSNGLIAPYQGFWIQSGAGGTNFDFTSSCKSSSAGTFYKTINDTIAGMSFSIASGDYRDKVFVSFMNDGKYGIDNADAYKLLPISPTDRVAALSYFEGIGLDINNLPYYYEGSITIPLDIMYLTLDGNQNFITEAHPITVGWNLNNLPNHISLMLVNNKTGDSVDLMNQNEISLKTLGKGSFPAFGSQGVNIYPQIGESLFTLKVIYNNLSSNNEQPILPKKFALFPPYPNPFNSQTTISFDLVTSETVHLQVYDIHGQWVDTLINGPLPSGYHSVQWKTNCLSSGIYLVQLKAGNMIFHQKITFIK